MIYLIYVLWSEKKTIGGYYKCNKFDANIDGNGNDQSDAAKAKRELNRYLHYYKRFHEHSQAQAFAKKSIKEVESRMVLLQEQNSSNWADVEFLKTANKQLVECRKVLKYSYAFAFYMENGEKKTRFEYHQEMLEVSFEACQIIYIVHTLSTRLIYFPSYI